MAADTLKKPAHRLFKLTAIADAIGVSIDTVDRYVRAGAIPVVRLPSGRRRVAEEDYDRIIDDWKAASR